MGQLPLQIILGLEYRQSNPGRNCIGLHRVWCTEADVVMLSMHMQRSHIQPIPLCVYV